ncbi:ATP-binding protein [Acidaminobacter sp. JC074]|uniref:ATP-binding protein n=1 Tax=Acidaminobacter sp. JC074 TaxID=2530199 RepID=UPI001F0D19DC|nr:ATP-binding protein [Acidaminobacter sp. JC074]MCH4887118.1 ATP-binding protein [Acidaminobacter sp. JC074]
MLERNEYYAIIEKFIDKPVIKVITGIRRSGKSTMLKLLQTHLKDRGIGDEDIIYVNFESMKNYNIRSSKSFYDYISSLVTSERRTYLFFDEIQLVDSWEEAVNSFLVDFNADIYITGSNSNLLSSELSTLLTGRYVQFRMYPLSFVEMTNFQNQLIGETDENILVDKYIRQGGFPAIHIAEYDEETAYMIINDIYDSIVLRDVVQRYNIRNIELLNRIMKYIMDNVGNTFSAKSISDYFKSQYRKVDITTVYNYIDALVSAFIIEKVNRYDLHGKEILKTQEKYYLADQGIQHAVFGYKNRNISGVLENIVYNELVRRGYKVYIGKIKDKEIDFIAEKKSDKLYVQVTYKMESEKTIAREFGPLLSVKDHYPKYVVSMDEHYEDNIEGVKHIYLMDFIRSNLF